jgi:D-amino-acid dehydrogenase
VKVLILGSGVIGVTSAYYLSKLGHDVTVIDRQPGPGLETSFANAGEISPGYASPWAAPGVAFKALKWMWRDHSPLIIQPRIDFAVALWLARFLRNCSKDRYDINKRRMLGLSAYSQTCLASLRSEAGIRYDERMLGTLQVFRRQSDFDGIGKDVEILKAVGVPFEVLNRAECVRCEPALGFASAELAGGLRLPGDETGDCLKFTIALAAQAKALGVKFIYNANIERICAAGDAIERVIVDGGEVCADTVVVCMGSYSPLLVQKIGLKLPVYPIKGYSLTIPIENAQGAPESTLMDDAYKVAITRLGDRIRVGGMAELCGFDRSLPLARRRTLEHSVQSLFPRGGDPRKGEFWAGFRPMTPDGTPIIGETRFRNLYLNTGHGTLGWTMACGSASILADIISGRKPALDASEYALARHVR